MDRSVVLGGESRYRKLLCDRCEGGRQFDPARCLKCAGHKYVYEPVEEDGYTLDEAFRRVAHDLITGYVHRVEKDKPIEHAYAVADSLTCHLAEKAREWHRLVNEELKRLEADKS